MFTAELYKIRNHRMPYVLTGLGALAAAAPAIYFAFKAPAEATTYGEAAFAAFTAYALLAASIFGGWILGHEYRQETLRRVVAVDARRGRILATKAAAGLTVIIGMLAAMLAAGLGSAAIAASIQGDSLVTTGLTGDLLGAAVYPLVALTLAFGLSAAFRSDTYATLATLSVFLVFAPLLSLIPKVGPYMLGSATDDVGVWLSESITPERGLATALLTIGAWLTATTFAGQQLFSRRDI